LLYRFLLSFTARKLFFFLPPLSMTLIISAPKCKDISGKLLPFDVASDMLINRRKTEI
jgi:hypothetical protein